MPLPTISNVTRPKALGYGLRINNDYYYLAVGPDMAISRAGEDPDEVINPSVDIQENPEDLDADRTSRVFSRVDFTGGEGLDFAHRKGLDDTATSRFWQSLQIEAVHSKGEPTYIQMTKALGGAGPVGTYTLTYALAPQMVYAPGVDKIFLAGNATNSHLVSVISTPGGTPSTATENASIAEGNQAISSLAVVDDEVYAALAGSNGIHKRDTAGTWTHYNALAASRLWGAKGRLVAIGTDEKSLYEVSASGAAPTATLTLGSAKFTCAADAGAAVLVGATNGYIYAFANLDGILTLRAQTPFTGEEITGIGFGQGVVLIGTRQVGTSSTVGRVYRATLSGNYTITDVQLLREFGIVSGNLNWAPASFTFGRDAVYFGLNATGSKFELWRYDLTTGGLFRHQQYLSDPGGMVGGAIVSDRHWICVWTGTSRIPLFESATNYNVTGWVISPLADFFTAENKSWSGARLWGISVPASTTAQLYYSTNEAALSDVSHVSWTLAKTLTAAVDDTEALLTGISARYLAAKIVLTPTLTATPKVRGFSFRAYPGIPEVELAIPVNISDQIERWGKRRQTVQGLGDKFYDQLKALEGSGVELELLATGETYKGQIRQVGLKLPTLTPRGSQTLVAMVRFKGRRTSG